MLAVKLTMKNWFTWFSALKEILNVFKDAGLEIRSKEPCALVKPVRPLQITTEFKDAEGVITTKTQNWNDSRDNPGFLVLEKEFLERTKQLARDRSDLWVFLVSNVSPEVLDRAQADREAYDKLQKEADCLGLYKLLYKTVMNNGSNDISNLRTRFHGLRQIDPLSNKRMPLSDFFREFEGYSSMLEGTPSKVSDDDKVEQLLNALDQEYFHEILFPLKIKQATTTYAKLKESLTKAEEVLSLRNPAKRPFTESNDQALNATHDAEDSHSDKRAKHNASENRSKRKTKNPHNGRNHKQNKQSPKDSSSNSDSKATIVCHNCNKKGHKSNVCRGPPAKCEKCGLMGHLTQFHRDPRAKSSNKASSNAEQTMIAQGGQYDNDSEDDAVCFFSHVDMNVKLVLDSGATVHVFNDPNIVKDVATICSVNKGTKLVGIAGALEVSGSGTIPSLGRFYIVPSAKANLVSVIEIVKQRNYEVRFDNKGCVIQSTQFDTIPPLFLPLNRDNTVTLNAEEFHSLAQAFERAFNAAHEDENGIVDLSNETANSTDKVSPPSNDEVRRAKQVIKLHTDSGHPSNKYLKLALKNGVILGSCLTERDVDLCERIFGKCIHCIAGKSTIPSQGVSNSPPATKVGEIVHVDILAFPSLTLAKNKYFVFALDEFSGFLTMIPLQSKDLHDLNKGLEQLINEFKTFSHIIKKIVSDSESVLISCTNFLGGKGIEMNHSPPYQHAQRVERYVRTLNERMRTILDSLPYDLPLFLYAELVLACITHLNDFPNSTHTTESPIMLFKGRKLDLRQRAPLAFGQLAMFHKTGQPLNKWEPRAELGIALGPSLHSHSTVRCYLFTHRKVYNRNRYTEINNIPYNFRWKLKHQLSASHNHLIDMILSPIKQDYVEDNQRYQVSSLEANLNSFTDDRVSGGDIPQDNLQEDYVIDAEELEAIDANNNTAQASVESDDNHTAVDNNNEGRPKRTSLSDWKSGPVRLRDYANVAFETYERAFRISIKKALEGEYKDQSKQAVLDEIKNMLDYNIGHYVFYDDIPSGCRGEILNTFMFIKHKFKPDGKYDKTKARLVADGANESSRLFDNISSSMVHLSTVFILLSLSTLYSAKCVTFDIKGAFLNCSTKNNSKKMFIVVRKDIANLWSQLDPTAERYLNKNGDLYLRLDKYLYGLKQSPLMFQQLLHEFLLSLNYQQCEQDDCLFVKKETETSWSIICTHVDDILQISTSDSLITELQTKLIDKFKEITFNENGDSYLGMSMSQSKDLKRITLSQSGFLEKILDKHLSKRTSFRDTPSGNNLFEIDKSSPPLKDKSKNNYLSCVMALMYLARLTRPDILLPVTFLASRCHCATESDFDKLSRVLMYLNKSKAKVLVVNCKSLKLTACCDASYGIHSDGKSHTGYLIKLGNSLILSRSVKQKITAISSTDAEIIALADVTKTLIWITNLLKEITAYNSTAEVFQDNQSAMKLATEPTKYKRSKHLLTKISFIRENIRSKMMSIIERRSELMTSDGLTKPKQGSSFTHHILDLIGDMDNIERKQSLANTRKSNHNM
jgi:hypothetical protein